MEQEEWLWAQAAKHGFAVSEGSFAVTRKQTYHFKKNGTRPVTLLVVTYEGVLQVTDPEAFKALLCEGVGRGKAYGLGLMTIIHREETMAEMPGFSPAHAGRSQRMFWTMAQMKRLFPRLRGAILNRIVSRLAVSAFPRMCGVPH